MLTLSKLKFYRGVRKIPRNVIAEVAAISPARLRDLDLRKAEPWFDEALLIARALCVTSIEQLIDPNEISKYDRDPRFFDSDLDHWRAGVRIPLSMALRLATRFGLERIDDLVTTPMVRQLWAVIESNERGAAVGQCPWCLADIAHGGSEGHLDTCLPNNILGPRKRMLGKFEEEARPGVKGRRVGSGPAHGLGACRALVGMTQNELAKAAGTNANYLSRIERLDAPLTLTRAKVLAKALGGFDVNELYRKHNLESDIQETTDASA